MWELYIKLLKKLVYMIREPRLYESNADRFRRQLEIQRKEARMGFKATKKKAKKKKVRYYQKRRIVEGLTNATCYFESLGSPQVISKIDEDRYVLKTSLYFDELGYITGN